jgi:hypothetical protein
LLADDGEDALFFNSASSFLYVVLCDFLSITLSGNVTRCLKKIQRLSGVALFLSGSSSAQPNDTFVNRTVSKDKIGIGLYQEYNLHQEVAY